MKNILCCLLFGMLWHTSFGQKIKKLNLGDRVAIQQQFALLNWKDSINFNSLKGKLVIIDFFTTGCVPCIQYVPKMVALQKKFDDRLKIIMVTSDTKLRMLQLIGGSNIMKNNTLPVITGDTLLKKLFPYRSVPTHVWIDSNGVLRYITDGESTTEQSLNQFFADHPLKLDVAQTTFRAGQHLWEHKEDGQFLKPTYISMLTGNINGVGGSSGFLMDSVTKKIIGYKGINILPTTMLRDAFQGHSRRFANWNQVILDVKDPSRFTYPVENGIKWAKEHTFCYELSVPLVLSDSVYTIIKQDIQRNLGLKGRIETRKTKCLALKLTDQNLLKTERKTRSIRYKADDYSDFEFTNVSFTDFFAVTFGNSNWRYPVLIFNETGFAQNVDIKLSSPITDLKQVSKELPKYGLKLEESYRMIDFLVISDDSTNKKF